jgi:GST-like protein
MAEEWVPPKKVEELFPSGSGNVFASINAPTAGARVQKELPVGHAPFQLYSLATPNGQKVGIMLEELGIEYDAHVINIGSGDQFNSGFVSVNPNSKIPSALDKDGPDGKPIHLFESASILLYLAEKYNKFLPTDKRHKTEVMNWLFWQMAGQGPMTGNFGHFMVYAPGDKKEARNYGVARYGMEVQRLCSVLDQHLANRKYMVGDEYTIADMCIYPWFNQLKVGYKHKSGIGAGQRQSKEGFKIGESPHIHICILFCIISGKPQEAVQQKSCLGNF